jgi:hypothetical protein
MNLALEDEDTIELMPVLLDDDAEGSLAWLKAHRIGTLLSGCVVKGPSACVLRVQVPLDTVLRSRACGGGAAALCWSIHGSTTVRAAWSAISCRCRCS